MAAFKKIVIIYNPKSTGPSEDKARNLQQQLRDGEFTGVIQLVPTQRAGHAIELSKAAAATDGSTLVVSSSGDGGYNEVINGAMAAQAIGAKPICAVLPSGNANDHRRTTREQPLWKGIIAAQPQPLDLIHVSITDDNGERLGRYAHSYIGLGLTPVVAVELNRYSLTAVREAIIVSRAFAQFQPLTLVTGGKVLLVDSLLISNVDGMAKVMKLAQRSRIDDGLLELNIFPHGHKLRLLGRLIGAVTVGLKPRRRIKDFEFELTKPAPMQLDGEVEELGENSRVHISCDRHAIQVIV